MVPEVLRYMADTIEEMVYSGLNYSNDDDNDSQGDIEEAKSSTFTPKSKEQ